MELGLVQKRYAQRRYADPNVQGDSFTINVINGLTNADMDVVTSIVSISGLREAILIMSMCSIGTVFS